MALIDKLTAIADAIRAKTGKTTTMTLDEMPTEIAGIEIDSVYASAIGILYKPNMVLNAEELTPSPSLTNYMFWQAVELETFDCNYPGLVGAQRVFSGCSKLKTVNLPRCTGMWLGNTRTFSGNSALERVTLGSVGVSVTRMDAGSFKTPAITLELYVNAETIADIPDLVKDYLPGQWNSEATIIYRNSTTGEVITE